MKKDDHIFDHFASPESLVEAIDQIKKGFDSLTRGGLNKKAIIVLLHDATGLPKRDVTKVLDELANFRNNYCTTPL